MDRRHVYGAGILLAGVFLAAIQVVHGLAQSETALVLAFEAGPFVLLALALSYTGYWLAGEPDYESELPRILAWGGGTTLLFASLAALMLFSQQVSLGTLDRAAYVAVDNVTIGAVVGVLLGLYDARSRSRMRALERERDRTDAFARKAADVNNYGRVLTRSDSVDEVSALCIEAMQALLGYSEVAMVAVSEEGSEVVANTVINATDEQLRSIGEAGLDGAGGADGDGAGVISHDDLETDLDADAEVVTLLVAETPSATFVLVALAGEEQTPRDEDVQLMEMLASHAGTALDSIYGVLDRADGERSRPT
jgi:hypothetical protein